MKLLILGLLAVVVLAAGSNRDCFRQWRTEARERSIEARQEARLAREEARERAREFREGQREQMRAWREAAREQRDRIRDEIHHDLRDWRYNY
jgi:vacuolar-type H+-ATPase subunit H